MSSTRIEQLIDNVQAAFDRRPADIEAGLDVEDVARRPARSEQPAEKAWGVSSHAAQSLALTRWRRGHIHFSPERARAVRRAPARPEWSVASDAEGGSGERGGPSRTHLFSRLRRLVSHLQSWRTQKGRGRLDRPPTPQAPQARGAQRWSRDVERPRAFECPSSTEAD